MRRTSLSVTLWMGLTLATASFLPAIEHPMLGDQAPPFTLPSLDGEQVSDLDFRGKYIVLHFGAGW